MNDDHVDGGLVLMTGVIVVSVRRKTRKLLILQGVTVYF